MITFTANQQRVIDADAKVVSWLFDVYMDGSSTPDYRWSHKTTTYSGDAYEFRIIPDSFSGVVLNRCNKESQIYSPTTCDFSVANPYNYIDDSVLDNCKIIVKLVAEDDTGEELLLQWAFICRYPERRQQTIFFKCTDFVTRYLNGFYPKTPLYKDVFPSTDPDVGGINDNMCIPVPVGTAYVPIRSVYISSDDRYYVLGPSSGKTYTINQVRSPRSRGANASYWNSADYVFQQSIKTGRDGVSYTVFQPIIAKSSGAASADSPGFWRSGDVFEDIPTQFSRDDTALMTNPADVIEFFLEDIGVPSEMIDSTSFSSAATTYDSWGLTFSGAFFFRQDRSKALSNLLTQCNSVLDCEEKIKLRVLEKSNVITITDDEIQRKSDESTTFTRSNIVNVSEDDSGYVALQSTTEPLDQLQKYVVPADTSSPTTDSPAGDIIQLWFIHDTQNAQTIGTLHYARKLGRKTESSLIGMSNILGIQPDDPYYVIGTDYLTNNYYASQVQINIDMSVKLRGYNTRFDVSDWGDLSPSAITVAEDTTTSAWQATMTGYDADTSSGGEQNVNVGKQKIGSGTSQIITEGDADEAKFYGGMTAYKTGTGLWFGYNDTLGEWEFSVGEAGVGGFYWSETDGPNAWGSWAGGGATSDFEEITFSYSGDDIAHIYTANLSGYGQLYISPSDVTGTPIDQLVFGSSSEQWEYIAARCSHGINLQIGDTLTTGEDRFVIFNQSFGLELVIQPANNYAYVNASSWTYSSDRSLKKDIKDVAGSALSKVLKFNVQEYKRKGKDKIEYGQIADELIKVLPEAVDPIPDTDGEKFGIKYNYTYDYGLMAIQEQQLLLDAAVSRIEDVEAELLKKAT